MTVWICSTCANHFPDTAQPPSGICVICADERQWVPPSGQSWTTLAQLAHSGHRSDVREQEPGLLGIGTMPDLAIGQRSLVVRTPEGNLLWDPSGFVDDAAIGAVRAIGGLVGVAASHPHFYASIVEWARAFDAPILLPEADAHWLTRPDPLLRTWSGTVEVLAGVTLVQCGGHFAGSAAVHWAAGAGGLGALLVGDTIMVTPGEDRVTFLRSAPNRLPLPEVAVRQVLAAIAPYRYDRIYGGWWTPVLRHRAADVVRASAARYLDWLRGEADPDW